MYLFTYELLRFKSGFLLNDIIGQNLSLLPLQIDIGLAKDGYLKLMKKITHLLHFSSGRSEELDVSRSNRLAVP